MWRMWLVLAIALPMQGRSLHWKAIDVQARLDAEGRLHVVERQRIVFDGDWNGGERNFNVVAPQSVQVHSVILIEEGGHEVALQRGSLEELHHYDLVSDSLLRWRSRLPSDPPFEKRELTYILDYTYDRILWQYEDRIAMAHDFGLPDRTGAVEQFTLNLDFDPRWNMPPVRTKTDLAPGQGLAVDRTFAIPAGAWPEGIVQHRPEWTGYAAFGLILAAFATLIALFIRAEAKRGRFARVEPKLDHELMRLRPEMLGAIWDAGVENTDLSDNGVGPSEVAAVLARLTQEGKIESRVEKKNLHMRLLVPRKELEGYERALVSLIFVDGEEMDTKKLKKHYRSKEFNPAETLRPAIHTAIANRVPGWNAKQKRFNAKTHVFSLLAIAAAIVLTAIYGDSEDTPELIFVGVIAGFIGVFLCAFGYSRSRVITGYVRQFYAPAILTLIPLALLALGALLAFPGRRLSVLGLTLCTLWVLAIVRCMLDLMKIPDPSAVLAVRKRAVAVREYFKEQLRQPQPALRDEWFPYLLAFGLGKHADRWFRAFGGTASSGDGSSSSWSGSGSSSGASGWTGGGGAFGGAGATGSWAAAAGSIAAGVSAGGSSSGGGGGSSGGGGGGGW